MSRLRMAVELVVLAVFVLLGLILISPTTFFAPSAEGLTEARFYTQLSGNVVQCQLCFRCCTIAPGQRGFCANRRNIEGVLYTLVHSNPGSVQIDPVEKEPLFHVSPGSRVLGIATAGCNFRCSFCINWQLAFRSVEDTRTEALSPEAAIQKALDWNCSSIHFTYTEPTVFFEYMLDVAKTARDHGLTTAFHSNGAMRPEPLREALMHMDAVVIDLKGFSDAFYARVIGPDVSGPYQDATPPLDQVLSTLQIVSEEGVWLEIVNLLIPTYNDDLDEIREMCVWIKQHLGDEVPLHFNRFFPSHKLMDLPSTPVETLEAARATALDVGLKYVYIGNVPGHAANSLYCPGCGAQLIERSHHEVVSNQLVAGRCPSCGYAVPGHW